MSNDLVVIDISHYQNVTSFEAIKNAGVVGVIMKATEGVSYVDAEYEKHRADAAAAGLAISTYHYLHHGSILEQMDHYLKTVDPDQGERVCLDFEDVACTINDLRQAIETIRKADETLQITVYSGHLIKEQLGNGYDDVLATTSLWIAQYTSAGSPSWPKGTWPTWTLWQYTDKANVDGIESLVDGNRFNGSAEQCLKWFGPATEPAPGPEPEPDEPEVVIDITATDGVKVTVLVNGDPR